MAELPPPPPRAPGTQAETISKLLGHVRFLLQEIRRVHASYESLRAELNDSFKCCVCMDNLRDTVIFPCKHCCLCYMCLKTVQRTNRCPICRGEVESFARFYLS